MDTTGDAGLAAARLRGEDPSIDTFRDHESTVIVVGEDQVVPPITGSAVGRSVWDVDGMDKTGGKLKFCDDYTAEDIGADTLLHGAFVWAPARTQRSTRWTTPPPNRRRALSAS